MFIIKTFQGEVKCDYDEIDIVTRAHPDQLVCLRRGFVRPKYISTIVPDLEAQSEILRLPGETEEDVQRKILEYKAPDEFAHMRGPALPGANDTKQLGHG